MDYYVPNWSRPQAVNVSRYIRSSSRHKGSLVAPIFPYQKHLSVDLKSSLRLALNGLSSGGEEKADGKDCTKI